MLNLIRSILAVVATAISLTAMADAASHASPVSDAELPREILPMNRLIATERGGMVSLVSDNGRFTFVGEVKDNWSGETLHTMEDFYRAANYLDFRDTRLDPADLSPLTYGTGAERVIAFVHPDLPQSRAFLEVLPELRDDFQFQIIMLPSHITPGEVTLGLVCPRDNDQAVNALISGSGMRELQPHNNCTQDLLQIRVLTVHLLAFDQFPIVIRSDSRIHRGEHDAWVSFLKEGMQ